MTYVPDRSQLQGLSRKVAECYGKPHIGCHYERDDAKSHVRDEGARCCCCGASATNAHHNPPLSKGRSFVLGTPMGIHVLKPALFALCGSGTTGCHDGFHGGSRFKAEWVWDSDEDAEAWWSGELLKRLSPHSVQLYEHGFWKITDKRNRTSFEVRL